ncbi:hypothetical protein [uncultured Pseudonocardia sp.]|uniref:hypothetical protein n=1 Tax=uncultured Pseudonocardia sp. TaxID=211455 RepID=UPI0026072C28|nr:hypothetical protein [uncultured Pseudonocardia sp.]
MSNEPPAGADRYVIRGEHWGAVNVGRRRVGLEVDGEPIADFTPEQALACGQALIAAAGDVPAGAVGRWIGRDWRNES